MVTHSKWLSWGVHGCQLLHKFFELYTTWNSRLYYSQSLATDTDPQPAAVNKGMNIRFLQMTGNFGVTEQLVVSQDRLFARIAISCHSNYSSKIVMSDWQSGFSSSFQVENSKYIDYALRKPGRKPMNISLSQISHKILLKSIRVYILHIYVINFRHSFEIFCYCCTVNYED